MDEGFREDASVSVEEGGVSSEDSAGEEDQLSCEVIGTRVPREALAKATAEDQSLQMVRQLARGERQGYAYKEGLILRSRLIHLESLTNKFAFLRSTGTSA